MHTSEQTHSGVLPQPRTLETAPADKAGVATKRGAVDGIRPTTGVQHGRGETTREGGVTPDPVPAGRAAGAGDRTITTSRVFVLDRKGRPLMPTHPARARELLRKGRARVHRLTPFTIRLVDVDATDPGVDVDGVELGIDPGSKTTGMAVFVTDAHGNRTAVSLIELVHRGLAIKMALSKRAALRRGRRSRNLRYRAPRFDNRTRKPADGLGVWLPPSVRHRVVTTVAWLDRLTRWLPISRVHVESARFDTHLLHDPRLVASATRRARWRAPRCASTCSPSTGTPASTVALPGWC